MSRPPGGPGGGGAGLQALHAAVAAVRREELARAARAGRVAQGQPWAPHRVSARGGRLAPGRRAAVDGAAEPSAEGAAAYALGLVQRAQAGEAAAFAELYDRYVDMVYRYVHYRVASPQLAEDLTSETFLRALRRIGSFTWQGRDVGAWFVTIARNLVADHYKSSRYRLELTTDDVADTAPPQVQEGPEEAVLAGLESARLLDAVRRLGQEQQECVALRFLQGLSVSETATVMNRTDGAVKALQYRAVRSLSRLLAEQDAQ